MTCVIRFALAALAIVSSVAIAAAAIATAQMPPSQTSSSYSINAPLGNPPRSVISRSLTPPAFPQKRVDEALIEKCGQSWRILPAICHTNFLRAALPAHLRPTMKPRIGWPPTREFGITDAADSRRYPSSRSGWPRTGRCEVVSQGGQQNRRAHLRPAAL